MRGDTMALPGGPTGPPPTGPVVIELGPDRGSVPDSARPGPRPGPVTWLLGTVLVLLTVAASAPPAPAPLLRTFRVGAAVGDTFAVSGNDLLVVRRQGRGVGLRVYEMDTGRVRWRSGASAPTASAIRRGGGVVFVGQRAIVDGATASVASGPTLTVALAADSGAELWRRTGRIMTIDPAADTVLAVSDVTSTFGAGRRIQDKIVALDARTGKPRWTVPVPSTAVPQPIPGAAPRILLVHGIGRMDLLDLADGRLLATAALPVASYAPDNPTVVGDTVVLRHPRGTTPAVTAYDVRSLVPRWSRAEPGGYDAVRPCGPLVCLAGPDGVRAVEPVGGQSHWFQPGWREVEPRGGYLLAYGSTASGTGLLGLAEPRTGQVLVGLRHWQAVLGSADADVLVSRPDGPDDTTLIAAADPDAGVLRVLGAVPTGTTNCRAAAGRLLCRVADDAFAAWTYPRPHRP